MRIHPSQPNDRHRRDSTQLKIWVPIDLKNEFASLCALQGVCASDVIRGLLIAYIKQSASTHG